MSFTKSFLKKWDKSVPVFFILFLFTSVIIHAAQSTMEFNGTSTSFNGITVLFSTGAFTSSTDESAMSLFSSHPYATPINGGNDYKDISISPATHIVRVTVAWGVNVAGFKLQFLYSNSVVKELTNFNEFGNIMSPTDFNVNSYVDKIRFLDAGVSNSGGFELSHITFDQSLPVELTNFNITVAKKGPILSWQTVTEINNCGFSVERKTKSEEWKKIGFVIGNGNSNSIKEYSFTDENVIDGYYFYRLKQIDNDGKYEYLKEVGVAVNEIPEKFELLQNYPNPFNPTTKIKFAIPSGGTSFMKFVQLKVYDVLGNKVATLVNEEKPAGNYEVEFNASSLPSGFYFCQLKSNSFIQTRKMLLLK